MRNIVIIFHNFEIYIFWNFLLVIYSWHRMYTMIYFHLITHDLTVLKSRDIFLCRHSGCLMRGGTWDGIIKIIYPVAPSSKDRQRVVAFCKINCESLSKRYYQVHSVNTAKGLCLLQNQLWEPFLALLSGAFSKCRQRVFAFCKIKCER